MGIDIKETPLNITALPPAGLSGTSDKWTGVLGTSNSGTGVFGKSTTGEGVVGSGMVNGVHGVTTSPAATGNGVLGENQGNGRGISGTSRGGVGVYGKGGTLAAQFDGATTINGDLNANGVVNATGDINASANINVIGDVILTGSDCAEDFDASSHLEPGTVVVIDEKGRLDASSTAYDGRVAGVISGAGAYRPGIVLGKDGRHQQGSGSSRRMPLALSGKVYCKADATFSRIEVGSLLTTSPTPGHAMRATDRDQAFGAVIGKALAGLEQGRGLIPILVSLQ